MVQRTLIEEPPVIPFIVMAQAYLVLSSSGIEGPPGFTAFVPPQVPPLEVTYIANEGFLVSVGEDKLLVDALHENPWGYPDTPMELREMMAGQEDPFQGVDLLVASHPHADHFSPGLVFSYLRQNPEVPFAATTATMGLLQDSTGAEYRTVQGQLREINPPWGESETLPLGEMGEVRFLTTNHMPEDRTPYLTLATLAKIRGRTILHLADLFPPTSFHLLEGYGLEEENIEILFADPGFVMSQEGMHLIREVIRPGNLILMHIRPDEWEGQKDEIMAAWPDAIVFRDPLERRVF
jgi:L-ascorbate metabolism protein UlaG (beta-lactamase superfamily)